MHCYSVNPKFFILSIYYLSYSVNYIFGVYYGYGLNYYYYGFGLNYYYYGVVYYYYYGGYYYYEVVYYYYYPYY